MVTLFLTGCSRLFDWNPKQPSSKIIVKGGAVSVNPSSNMTWTNPNSAVFSSTTVNGITPTQYAMPGFQGGSAKAQQFNQGGYIKETTTDGTIKITFGNNIATFSADGKWFGIVSSDDNSRQYCGGDNSCKEQISVTFARVFDSNGKLLAQGPCTSTDCDLTVIQPN
jgi:hypothetical protein